MLQSNQSSTSTSLTTSRIIVIQSKLQSKFLSPNIVDFIPTQTLRHNIFQPQNLLCYILKHQYQMKPAKHLVRETDQKSPWMSKCNPEPNPLLISQYVINDKALYNELGPNVILIFDQVAFKQRIRGCNFTHHQPDQNKIRESHNPDNQIHTS